MARRGAQRTNQAAGEIGHRIASEGAGAWPTLKRLWSQCIRDDVLGMASELAYRFFLAIFPFFMFLAALGKPIALLLGWPDPADQMSELLSQVMPAEAAGVFRTEIARVIELTNPGLLPLTFAGALWVATGGTAAVMKAANRAYSVEETRPWWKRYLTAFALTLCAGIAIVGGFILVVAGSVLGDRLASGLGLEDVYRRGIDLASWPIVAVLLTLGISTLYRLGPNLHLRWGDVIPGALVFSVGWLIGTVIFSSYIEHVGSYGITYGTLAGVVVLLLWFYVTGLLLLVGLEVGAATAEKKDTGEIAAQQQRTRQERDVRQLPPKASHPQPGDRVA
jgi:membrane protein